MTEFLITQLDFIFFFYGLAFVLLGTVCLAIKRSGQHDAPWGFLTAFALIHGASEWLDLISLSIGDGPLFSSIRTAVTAVSFALLFEFARRGMQMREARIPGLWIYAPLAVLVAATGALHGTVPANVVARYSFGFLGAIGTSLVFLQMARQTAGPQTRWALGAAAGFALYGLAAGWIVPAAQLWPASALNQAAFQRWTGVPIQLIRGLLACLLALCVWKIWGQRALAAAGASEYGAYLRRQYARTLVATLTIVAIGWTLTQFLGNVASENMQEEAASDIALLASRFAAETAAMESVARSIARSPAARSVLLSGRRDHDAQALSTLRGSVEDASLEAAFLLAPSGSIVAASNPSSSESALSRSDRSQAMIRASMAGRAGFFVDAGTAAAGETAEHASLYTSYPVRDATGAVIGAAVAEKSLDGLASDLADFHLPFFLVEASGLIVFSNRAQYVEGALWPPSSRTGSVSSQPAGQPNRGTVLQRQVTDGSSVLFEEEHVYVKRHDAGPRGWSVVLFSPPNRSYASRFLGIVITLLIVALTLIHIAGMDRIVRDSIALRARLILEERARNLELQATTDPLTGIANRLRFNQELADAMARFERHGTAVSLIMLDADRFKSINDSHGHSVGDRVLIDLSKVVAREIRNLDILARWGGEEFAVLVPSADAHAAAILAERVRAAIESFKFEGVGTVTCSFGVAECRKEDTAEALTARADAALYRAKANGRNRVEVGG